MREGSWPAARDPRCLRRSAHTDRIAAALVYLAGRANGEFGRRGRRTAHSLWRWWGISSCADRARTLRGAAGLEPSSPFERWSNDIVLGDPALLHSQFREHLCRRRDYLEEFAPRPKVMPLPGGRQARVEAELVKAVVAAKGIAGSRTVVILGLGYDIEEASFHALSIPEAHQLVRIMQDALAAPAPR